MCGLVGVIGPRRAGLDGQLAAITSTLSHRGPDSSGRWRAGFDRSGEPWLVGLGHTRLSIIDLSERGSQPMTSADGRLTVAHNGEIYNFRELRRELEALGRRFRSDSDTEVILEAYAEWGTGAWERFSGMFAFALWDGAARRLFLVRDRLGIKPLFYAPLGDGLLFGSELGALRAHPGFDDAIDRGALGRFLAYGYVCGPETIYAAARRLMPGECLEWRDGAVSHSSFWTLAPLAEPPPADLPAAVDRLEQLLEAAVEERRVADVPLGAFLSGGIDSSTVVALLQRASGEPVRTFTIGFDDAGYDEAPYARAVAAHLGTDHTELTVGRDEARSALRDLPRLYDEPFGDASAIPTTLVSRLARRDVKVVLSGDGGDELFGGYGRYRRLAALEPWLRLPRPLRRLAASAASLAPRSSLRNGLRLLACRGPLEAADRISARFEPEAIAACCGARAADPRPEFVRAWGEAAVDGIARKAMFADVRTYLVDDILTKLDRASMSVGLEGRVPLLDHRVVAFALSLPLGLLWSEGRTKGPLRALAHRHLPPGLLERPKSGFGFPVASLLGPELERWTRHYLAPGRLAEEGLLEPAAVQRLVDSCDPRDRTGIKGLWHLLCFERWFAHVHRGERDPA